MSLLFILKPGQVVDVTCLCPLRVYAVLMYPLLTPQAIKLCTALRAKAFGALVPKLPIMQIPVNNKKHKHLYITGIRNIYRVISTFLIMGKSIRKVKTIFFYL